MQASTPTSPLHLINQVHGQIENLYFESRKDKGAEGRHEQKRLLLADLACHLGQDALRPGELNTASLKNHLYAILTLCNDFLPEQDLKQKPRRYW